MDLRFRRESGLARASALAAPLRRKAQRPYGGWCRGATGGWCSAATGGWCRAATGGRCRGATEDGVGAQRADRACSAATVDGAAPQQADGVGALRAAVSKPASSHRWTCVFGEKAGLLARAAVSKPLWQIRYSYRWREEKNMSKASHSDIEERCERQLARLEQIIAELIAGLDLTELSSAERLNYTIKIVPLHTRLLALRLNCAPGEDESERENALNAALMRHMRGEM